MTLGISISDIVKLPDGSLGEVIGIDDWSDRWPADLQVITEMIDFNGYFRNVSYCTLKFRADEVIKISVQN